MLEREREKLQNMNKETRKDIRNRIVNELIGLEHRLNLKKYSGYN